MRSILFFVSVVLLAVSVWLSPTEVSVASAATYEPLRTIIAAPGLAEAASAVFRALLNVSAWACVLVILFVPKPAPASPIWHE
jgi:hypothetical protein